MLFEIISMTTCKIIGQNRFFEFLIFFWKFFDFWFLKFFIFWKLKKFESWKNAKFSWKNWKFEKNLNFCENHPAMPCHHHWPLTFFLPFARHPLLLLLFLGHLFCLNFYFNIFQFGCFSFDAKSDFNFNFNQNYAKMKTNFFTSLRKSWQKFLERRETTTNFVEIGKNIFFCKKKLTFFWWWENFSVLKG
jgi:hypothetical protein